MVTISIVYEGQLRTSAVHGPSATQLVTDAPRDNQGKGESFSPTDLVATALGSCMVTIMGIVARNHAIALEGATVRIEKEMCADPLRRIDTLRVRIGLPNGINEADRTKLENAARTCPVAQSISERIHVPIEFVPLEAGG